MAEQLGWVGDEVDLVVRQGQTFTLRLQVQTPALSPRDLTGTTIQAQVRKRARASAVSAAFQPVVVDAAGGVVDLVLAHEVTAALLCGESLYDADSEYVYDVELHDGGAVLPLLWGKLRVHREVTRV